MNGVQRRVEDPGGRGRQSGGPVDRAVGLGLGAGFAGVSGDREHGGTAGRHAVGRPPDSHWVPVRADGDEAGGGDVPVRRAADRRGAPGARHRGKNRAALEAGSVAWWLLEENLSARERVCRMQLLRRNSAREHAKSIKEVGEDPTVAGKETVTGIEAECRDLGLAAFTQRGDELEGQTRPGYTARVKALTDELGYQGGYSIYSSAAHAELAGIWRLFGETGATFPAREPIYGPAANVKASFAAADGGLKSMMGPMERIALLFG